MSRALNPTALLHSFIKEKYRSGPISVIVANGFDALQFAVSLRTEIDPGIRIVFSGVDGNTGAQLKLPPNVTGTTIHRTVRHVLITAKALVPGLKRIAVVGDRLEEQTYRRHYKNELPTIDKDVEFIDLTGLPMEELRKRVATLPADAAIFFTTLIFGSGGAQYDPNEALALVAEVANRPIVIDQETRLGHGGTGGYSCFRQCQLARLMRKSCYACSAVKVLRRSRLWLASSSNRSSTGAS